MINRVLLMLIAGCVVFGGLIVVELRTDGASASASAAVPVRAELATPPATPRPRVDDLVAAILGRPVFSPTRQPASHPGQPTGLDLGNVRLTGIVIGPEHHLAIFAVPDAKPVVRSEGEMVNDWRLESIAPGEVVLSGPAGTRTLEPKVDASLTRRIAAAPRPAPSPPQASARTPAVAAAPKPPLTPAAQPPGTPMTPRRPQGAPRDRQ